MPESQPQSGRAYVKVSAEWLRVNLGTAPDIALVLGSGLRVAADVGEEPPVPFSQVPFWPSGRLAGHPRRIVRARLEGKRFAVLEGRLHEYEGASLAEVQLPVRSLSAWGVSSVILTTASGGVGEDMRPGQVLVADKVLDLQHRGPDGRPALLKASDKSLGAAISTRTTFLDRGVEVIHASVSGPQYETPAELDVLRAAGVSTVSMSPAGELLAALDEGMRTAVFAVVTNVGQTTHEEVVAAGVHASAALTEAVGALCRAWV